MYGIKIHYKDRTEDSLTHYTIFGISYIIQARGFVGTLMNFIYTKHIYYL